jgi:hypothetical protein
MLKADKILMRVENPQAGLKKAIPSPRAFYDLEDALANLMRPEMLKSGRTMGRPGKT